MYTLRRAFLAGVLASLVLALFDFVTDGAPGNHRSRAPHRAGARRALVAAL